MAPTPSRSSSAAPGGSTKRPAVDVPPKAAARVPSRPSASTLPSAAAKAAAPIASKEAPPSIPTERRASRPAVGSSASDLKKAAPTQAPESKGQEASVPPGAVVVYLAVRHNDDVKVDVPGRAEGRMKTAPGGWRAALFLDTGDGVEAMNRAGEDKIPMVKNGPNELAATSFGILKAIEFVHDQRPETTLIILRTHHDNAFDAEHNRAHPSSRYNWVARQNLEKWGMRLQVEIVHRTENKATTVLPKTDMPNYWTGVSRANPQLSPPGAARSVGASTGSILSGGWDGRAALFDTSMNAEEIKARISVIQEQLVIANAILGVKEPSEARQQKI